jgi:hypothetical protein
MNALVRSVATVQFEMLCCNLENGHAGVVVRDLHRLSQYQLASLCSELVIYRRNMFVITEVYYICQLSKHCHVHLVRQKLCSMGCPLVHALLCFANCDDFLNILLGVAHC